MHICFQDFVSENSCFYGQKGKRTLIWPQILCLSCFSALNKECSVEYLQYLVPSFYTLLPLKTSKSIAKEDSHTLFSTCRNLNSCRMTCWGSPCKPTTESRADFRSSSIVYSAFLVRWWFSGWKLHGWMVSFANAEVCLCNDLLTDLQSTHSNLLCLWHSWETINVYWIVSISNIGHSSVTSPWEWEKFIHVRPLTLVDSSPMKLTIVSGIEVNTHMHTDARTHTLEPWTMLLLKVLYEVLWDYL